MEQRLVQDPLVQESMLPSIATSDYLVEYQVGHMTKSFPTEIVKPDQLYYIPHHAVLHDSNTITRLQVIFNASCRTTNGMIVERSYAYWP